MNKSPVKTNQSDIDNDEFFSQLKPPPKSKSFASPQSSEKTGSNNKSDPWSSPTLTHANNGSNVNKQITSEPDVFWANENKIPSPRAQLNLNLDDPWSTSTTNAPLAPAIIPSANNPWSNSVATNVTNKSLEINDPWLTKATEARPTPNVNASIWPSLSEPSQQPSNTASLLTNNILNNLWSTSTSNNPITNTASAFSAPIVRTSSSTVSNPFLGNGIFPSSNSNGSTIPNYSALSQPWLLSSTNTPSNTVTSSSKTNNPFLD